MKVILGNVELEVPQGIELIEPARVVSHPIEKGFDVTDHTALEPRQFRLTATFYEKDRYEDRYASLYMLQKEREPFKVLTPVLVMSNAMITKISTVHSTTHGEIKCVIDIKEVKTATVSIVQLEEMPGDIVETPFDGGEGNPATNPESELEPDSSWWGWTDAFIDPVTDFWGDIWP